MRLSTSDGVASPYCWSRLIFSVPFVISGNPAILANSATLIPFRSRTDLTYLPNALSTNVFSSIVFTPECGTSILARTQLPSYRHGLILALLLLAGQLQGLHGKFCLPV